MYSIIHTAWHDVLCFTSQYTLHALIHVFIELPVCFTTYQTFSFYLLLSNYALSIWIHFFNYSRKHMSIGSPFTLLCKKKSCWLWHIIGWVHVFLFWVNELWGLDLTGTQAGLVTWWTSRIMLNLSSGYTLYKTQLWKKVNKIAISQQLTKRVKYIRRKENLLWKYSCNSFEIVCTSIL